MEVGYRLENPPEDAAELEDIALMDLLKRKWNPLEIHRVWEIHKRYGKSTENPLKDAAKFEDIVLMDLLKEEEST